MSFIKRCFLAFAAVLIGGCAGAVVPGTSPGTQSVRTDDRTPQQLRAIPIYSPAPSQRVCPPPQLGTAACHAVQRTNVTPIADSAALPASAIPGYHPIDLQTAYMLPSSSQGNGQTVGVVVAYDDPNAETDMNVYRAKFGLPLCTAASGCFHKMGQIGPALPHPNAGWSMEASIDLDMVSATCPNCRVLLVEANTTSINDLAAAVSAAVKNGATVVSNSYTAPEDSTVLTTESRWSHPGVPIVAGTGDGGYGVGWPASNRYVIAVGGTTLVPNSSVRGWSETAWSGSGSGCSAYIPRPSWQPATFCATRSIADVAAVADPNPGVAVFDSYNAGGWMVFGGTSVATPIVASTIALAGNAKFVSDASYIAYRNQYLNQVTSGSTGSCGTLACNAGPGYDGPTGWGTPNGVAAF